MRRRDLLAFIALTVGMSAACAPRAVAKDKLWRIGYLDLNLPPTTERPSCNIRAFQKGLSELGYEEGRDYLIEARFADTDQSRLPTLAKELVDLGVDVIVTFGTAPVRAAKQATTTIPIVMAGGGGNDPIGNGFIVSLAHPGGNVTGITRVPTDASLNAKALQILTELVPNISRLATLGILTTSYPGMRAAAEKLKITVLEHDLSAVKSGSDFGAILNKIIDERTDAVFAPGNFVNDKYRKELLNFLSNNHLASMFEESSWVERGEGLLSYFSDVEDLRRRAASYVDKIWKGAKPANLPVEEPTRFKLVINLRTANALSLTVPRSLLQSADELIEEAPPSHECQF